MGRPTAEGESAATPETWPRDPRERAQPRRRLNQALTVARQQADPSDPWPEPQERPGAEPVVDDPFPEAELYDDRLDEFRAGVPDHEETPSEWGSARAFQRTFSDILSTDAQPEAQPEARPQVPTSEPVAPLESLAINDPIEEAERVSTAIGGRGSGAQYAGGLPEGAASSEAQPVVESPSSVVVDLRDAAEAPKRQLATTDSGTHYGLGQSWGRSWRDSDQGWVSTPSGEPVWRPVVATTHELSSWDVDTYLGVVTAEVAVEVGTDDYRQMGSTLARGREIGVEGLVEEAIERGAHAVIGVSMQYTPLGERLLLTISGTAVTLREKRR